MNYENDALKQLAKIRRENQLWQREKLAFYASALSLLTKVYLSNLLKDSEVTKLSREIITTIEQKIREIEDAEIQRHKTDSRAFIWN